KGKGEREKGKGKRGKGKGERERGKGKGERFQIHRLPLTPKPFPRPQGKFILLIRAVLATHLIEIHR
ncbi:hypothetical protein FACHB389_32795, partial [Nostoc calcicola FACHB-389]